MAAVLGARARRSAPSRSRAFPSSTCSTCFPIRRAKACTSAIPRATPRPTCSAATSACGASTCCTRWATTRSDCRPSSTPSRPARIRGSRRSGTSPTSAARSSGSASATTGTASSPRPTPSTALDAVDLSRAVRHLVRPDCDGQTAARRGGPPSPSCRFPPTSARRARPRCAAIRTPSGSPIQAESPVNWCAALGTVLADEEVINGRSERGDHPVVSACRCASGCCASPLTPTGWSKISTTLDWPDPIKEMQRNWVGRSEGRGGRFLPTGRERRSGPDSDPDPSDLHDAARHAVRRDLHGAGARASAGRSRIDRPHGRHARGRRRVPAARGVA